MPTRDSRKAAHNAKVRQRLIDAAARLFRQGGVTGTTIDAVMQAAGLTRGAFYAHFASKEALFAAVLREAHPLRDRLQALDDADEAGLRALFRDYLAPPNLAAVATGCTFVALTGEAARAAPPARAALAEARDSVLAEIGRLSPRLSPDRADAALSLAIGALQSAAVDPDASRRGAVLMHAGAVVDVLLSSDAPHAAPTTTQSRLTSPR